MAWDFGFRKKGDCTIYVAKTKALISCAVTAQLICVFVFAYAKVRFSHDEAQMRLVMRNLFFASVNNKGAGEPRCAVLSVPLIVCCLYSLKSLAPIAKISSLCLTAVAAQTASSLK